MRTKTMKPLSRLYSAGLGLLLACLVSHAAFAADADATVTATVKAPQPVAVTLSQFKVSQDAKGAPILVDAKVVAPGDVIEYRAVYKNQSLAPLSVAATIPVPEALEYIKGSAAAKAANSGPIAHTVALKDNQYAPEPLMRRLITADGASVAHAVPYAEYRSVRWMLEKMAPGSSVEVSLRAKVAENQVPSVDAAQ